MKIKTQVKAGNGSPIPPVPTRLAQMLKMGNIRNVPA